MSVPAEAIEIAHEADLLNLAQIYGVVLKRAGANEFAGGCPTCGGVDRFSINVKKRVWNCRQCSLGGDPIALVMHVEGCSFAEAVERLTGGAWRPSERKRPIPTSDSGGPAREISKARQRWSEGVDPRGTIVEKYLLGRGLELSDDIASELLGFTVIVLGKATTAPWSTSRSCSRSCARSRPTRSWPCPADD